MSDNLKDRGPQDRSRINVHESWELEYWSKKFKVSGERLKEAVKKVGVSAKNVEEELKKYATSCPISMASSAKSQGWSIASPLCTAGEPLANGFGAPQPLEDFFIPFVPSLALQTVPVEGPTETGGLGHVVTVGPR